MIKVAHKTEIEHSYGPQVHILDHTYLEGILARLCSPEVFQPEINQLVERLYSHLLVAVMNREFPKEDFKIPTRMTAQHPEQMLQGQRLSPKQRVVVVNLARAGTLPSHICYNNLHYVIEQQFLRQDHIFAARAVDSHNHVTGTDLGSSKIGGDVDNAIVLFPDPMGATGNTIISALSHYKHKVAGSAQKMIALHLIVTPEYLKNVLKAHPDITIFALRLDRGLSSEAALKAQPGALWDQERGLNEKDYIVPGGGGFGEIMNNSFV